VAGFTIPSTWYQSFNPFMIWLLVPVLNALWAWQARRGSEPSSVVKLAIGCALEGVGFVVMMAAQAGAEPGQRQSVWWLVGATAIFTVGELYLSPIGLSFVTKVAPARIVSMMMGVWFFANFIGNTLAGWLGSFYEVMPRQSFFALMLAIGLGGGAVLWVMSRRLDRITGAHLAQQAAALP
jgi:POT family proton-dependent oligopeptide transporter